MIEDKLTPEERLRLECIAQSNQSSLSRVGASTTEIIERAKRFEEYIKGEER